MTLELKHEGFEEYLLARKPKVDGVQYLFRFKNGYGASVIKWSFTFGYDDDLWELAIIKFEGDSNSFSLYDDPVGNLTDSEVCEYLKKIKNM